MRAQAVKRDPDQAPRADSPNGRCERGARRAGGQEVTLAIAAGLFLAESILFAVSYVNGGSDGFFLTLNTNPLGTYALLLGVGLAAAGLSVYALVTVSGRLQARLIARWSREDSVEAEPSMRRSRRAGSWPADAASATAAVLFFSESMTLAIVLLASYSSGFSVAITMNTYGEFWVELPLVLLAVPLAAQRLYASLGPLLHTLDQRSRVERATPELRLRRWLLAEGTRPLPARRWSAELAAPGVATSGSFLRADRNRRWSRAARPGGIDGSD